jgi:hypothetical protein
MLKSTIISTCLLNSRMVTRIEDGEAIVRQVFSDERPSVNFATWNSDVTDSFANHVIGTVGRAKTIDVIEFIATLDD